MKIAVIQQHASTDNQDNLTRGLNATDKAAEMGAKLAVFAELAFTRFFLRTARTNLSYIFQKKCPDPPLKHSWKKRKNTAWLL